MGMQDRDWYKEEMRERERKSRQKPKSRFAFRLPKLRKKYDLSAYNFEKKQTFHPVLIAIFWAVVFLVLYVIFRRAR